MWYFVAGSVFIALSITWAILKRRWERNEKYDAAEKDAKKAVEKHDTAALFDSIRRMRQHR